MISNVKNGVYPLASIIITTKDRFASLLITLGNLACQTYPFQAMEVFVIDAGSDETEEKIKKFSAKLPYQLFYKHCEGLSISAARNVAIKEARGEYIIILDDDVYPAPQFIKAHVSMHLFYPQSIVQGELLPAPGTALLDRARLEDVTKFRRDDTGMNHCNVHTFNVSCPRKYALEEIFDEKIDQYGWEDVEWGYRLITKRDLKLRYAKEARAFHYKPHQTYQGVARENFLGSKGMLYFLKKHPDILEQDAPCLLKNHSRWLVKEIHNFLPLTLSELVQKKELFSALEARENLPGRQTVRKEVIEAYHEIENYAAREGAWCRFHEIPVEKSIFCAKDSELFSCLVRQPIDLRCLRQESTQMNELVEFYRKVFNPFCGGEEQKRLSLEISPLQPPENLETPYAAAICVPSVWKIFPTFLSSYREIMVPSRFDQKILSNCGISSSLLPFGVEWENIMRMLLRPKIHLPGTFIFFADGGCDFSASGIAKVVRSFLKGFGSKERAALVIGFQKEEEVRSRHFLAEVLGEASGKSKPPVFSYFYESSRGRQRIMASSDCVVYAGAGESIVLSLFEAAAMGKGILATAFGGHLDFLDESSSIFLPCEIVTPNWRPTAEVKEEALLEKLRYVYAHPEELKERGIKAKISVQKKNSFKQIRKLAFLKIFELVQIFSY